MEGAGPMPLNVAPRPPAEADAIYEHLARLFGEMGGAGEEDASALIGRLARLTIVLAQHIGDAAVVVNVQNA